MTVSAGEFTKSWARPDWHIGVRARLLLAFLAISAFAVLAAAAGIYAFREVGARLQVIDTRVPPTLSALEFSRSAERIITAAPALLAVDAPARRGEVQAELTALVGSLNAQLRGLEAETSSPLPLDPLETTLSSLAEGLARLNAVVARRLEVDERIGAWRQDVLRVNGEAQRLLSPWLEVIDSEVSSIVDSVDGTSRDGAKESGRLASLIDLDRATQSALRQFSSSVEMLSEASTTDQARRLPILEFQLRLALGNLAETSNELDPSLRPLFLAQVAQLGEFIDGPRSITEARSRELALIAEGKELLAEATEFSVRLSAAVDRLGSAAKQEIGAAVDDALWVQHLSTRALLGVAALSLLTSFLMVWLYVGGNIVRRLTALSDGMLAIAGGRLRTPVDVGGTDEIADMGRALETFRENAIDLERLLEERKDAAARLERLVKERTHELMEKSRELESANRYKSHFLASASHDLRQPLHALTLFVARLRAARDPAERDRLVRQTAAAVSSINELFESLLDMSRLEAGILEAQIAEFPVEHVLDRLGTTFADAAGQKGLRLSVMPCRARVRSDLILLERILMNLLSNAVRYTEQGGIVVGCRRRGASLRIDVCDTGQGIPEEQRQKIFAEYYRLSGNAAGHGGGFGLGLAIVDRLGRLLDHRIELDSRPGHGSRFSVSVPLAAPQAEAAEQQSFASIVDPANGKLVVVIDDDPLVLEGMSAILTEWGCQVITADGGETALPRLAKLRRRPDLIISDYQLANGSTGLEVIERLRCVFGAPVPAFLISGDTAPERLRDAGKCGIHLLHKPVAPMRLRAMVNRALQPQALVQVIAPAAE